MDIDDGDEDQCDDKDAYYGIDGDDLYYGSGGVDDGEGDNDEDDKYGDISDDDVVNKTTIRNQTKENFIAKPYI